MKGGYYYLEGIVVSSTGPDPDRPASFLVSLYNFSDLCLRMSALSLLDSRSSSEK